MQVLPEHFPSEIVTVTSRDYLPGTWVMLHSFLRTNAWFDGEITILQDDLEESDKAALQASFSKLSFPAPSADLTDAIEKLVAEVPKLKSRARRFLSLDAFHPERSGRVLFCDSDLLFRDNIGAMVACEGSLIACGDRAQLIGTGRDPVTLGEGTQADGFASFNAGLMLIGAELPTRTTWERLLAELAVDTWEELASDHTDQAIYNRLFGNRVTLADPAYNYLVGHAGNLRSGGIAPMTHAKVLHFNGPAKPWNFATHLAATSADAGYVRAAEYWFGAYIQCLSAYHFASAR